MINIQKSTPSVYFNNSRDFQAVGRTLELLLNYVQMNIDNMEGNYRIDNMNPTLLKYLLANLGFEGSHEYVNVDLLILAKVFKWMMKKKGTRLAIKYIIYVVLRSFHYEYMFDVFIPTLDQFIMRPIDMSTQDISELYQIQIILPTAIKDTTLIEDLLDYILPTGFTYRIINSDTKLKELTSVDLTVNQPTITKYAQGSLETNGVYYSEDNLGGDTYKSVVYGGENNNE